MFGGFNYFTYLCSVKQLRKEDNMETIIANKLYEFMERGNIDADGLYYVYKVFKRYCEGLNVKKVIEIILNKEDKETINTYFKCLKIIYDEN